MQTHVDQGLAMLDAAKTTFEKRDVIFELDMAYVGQTHTVSVPLSVVMDGTTVTEPTRAEIADAFDTAYHATYGRLLKNGVRRVMNLRSAVIGRRPKFDLKALAPKDGGTLDSALKTCRKVHFGDKWHDTSIYDRLSLPVGTVVHGPAILEQLDTTILIEPDLQGTIDAYGNVIIERRA
jgi:N-methylhydantoinase A